LPSKNGTSRGGQSNWTGETSRDRGSMERSTVGQYQNYWAEGLVCLRGEESEWGTFIRGDDSPVRIFGKTKRTRGGSRAGLIQNRRAPEGPNRRAAECAQEESSMIRSTANSGKSSKRKGEGVRRPGARSGSQSPSAACFTEGSDLTR